MLRVTLFVFLLLFFFSTPNAAQVPSLQHVATARFFSGLMRRIRNTFTFSRPPTVVPQKMSTGHRYIAFGDSFASGAGSGGGTYAPHANDYDRCCYRKRNAYPSLLMTSMGVSSFQFRACRGAMILRGRNSVREQVLSTRTDKRAISFVTVTVGGNDMGFSSIITQCMLSRLGARKRCRRAIRKANALVLSKVARDIRKLDRMLRTTFPNALVVFTGYPIPYFHGRSGTSSRFCRSQEMRRLMNDLTAALNKAIRNNVGNFVPISFRGRELCRRGAKPWINSGINTTVRMARRCRTRRRIAGAVGGLYHPSREGQRQYSREIEKWYANNRRRTT